jgi:hypothetical protein
MPIVNGTYKQQTADEILADLETELQNEFGEDIDLTQSSVFTTLATTLATVLADNTEASLEDVYNAAFLETAEGADLDRVVAIIGIQRRSAVRATGVQRFVSSSKVEQDYVIQRGTVVQTREDSPTEFETTDVTTLELLDSFEDGDISEYSGDTANGSVITDSNAPHGDNVLQMDATDGAYIYNDNVTLKQGGKYHCSVRPQTSTQPSVLIGVNPLDTDDHYQLVFDEASDEVRLELVLGGSIDTTIATATAVGLTANEFHEATIDWQITNDFDITISDNEGNELATLNGSDGTFIEGYGGFKSNDGNDTKAFDWYTTSEVSANIRARVGGTDGNVA